MTFAYDRYGNRTSQAGSGGAPSVSFGVSAYSNRILASHGCGYDAAARPRRETGFQSEF